MAAAPLSRDDRRRSLARAYANGGLWGLGNGLVSTTLVIYLALELGAVRVGLGIALIRAAPQLVGLLRIAAPAAIGRLADRRRFCIACYLGSVIVLFFVPLLAAPGRMASADVSLGVLVALWGLYHLLEYMGTIALWSWLGDLVPQPVRGAFIGRRQLCVRVGSLIGMMASGLFTFYWKEHHAKPIWWQGYALSAYAGGFFLLAAVVPLRGMAGVTIGAIARCGADVASMLKPFADRRFLRLVLFGCWLSFFNGISQAAQGIYAPVILGLTLMVMLSFRSTMMLGQAAMSPWLGRLTDRIGNRPVMIVCQVLVATGPLFYLLATPDSPWWIAGAWIAWIAYAGLNIGLTNLMLKLAPPEEKTTYVAMNFTVTGLAFAVSTILGGLALDAYRDSWIQLTADGAAWSYFDCVFLLSWLGRTLGVVWLVLIVEPGARLLVCRSKT